MKKNIGILFSSSRKMGVFQYGLSIAEALINFSDEYDYTILYFENESPKESLKVKNIEALRFVSLDATPNNLLGKIKFLLNVFLGHPFFTTNKKNKAIMKDVHVDLLIIPFQLLFGFEHQIPYMGSLPDVMYKYYPNLPEYSFKGRMINNVVFKYSTKYSVLTIAESEAGKADIHKFFHTPNDKIEAIPLFPAGYVFEMKNMTSQEGRIILARYNLPEKFIFYPAQFWAHKNHINLIKAIKIAKEKYGQTIPLVLVGNDKANSENYNNIMELAEKLNIKDRILHLGYVTDEEVVALYKTAAALVFPTLIGPTSIPPLEGMVLGTPVLCSNLFSMPQQLGDAGVLFDPFNPDDMAEKIANVFKDEELRKRMIEKGLERAKNFTDENYAAMWLGAVKKALSSIKNGK